MGAQMTILDERTLAPSATTFPASPRWLRPDTTAQFFALGQANYRLERQLNVQLVDRQGEMTRPEWVRRLGSQLNELLELGEGWDGYRAKSISEFSVKAVIAIMVEVMNDGLAFPHIFPLPDGGLQLEWHADGDDVELEVEANGSAFAFIRDRNGNVVVEGDVAVRDLDSTSPTVLDDTSRELLSKVSVTVERLTRQIQEHRHQM